ncbi:MAG: sulfatase-like hydrolase/transferase, partial [Novosphingobium sp.]
MKVPIKALLVLVSVAAGYQAAADRIGSLGLSIGLLLYFGIFACLALCLVLAAYVRSTILRGTYALLLAVSALSLTAYERITREQLSYDAFINLFNSAGFVDEALSQHASAILGGIGISLLLFGAIVAPPRLKPPKWALAPAAPLIGTALLSAILFARGGEGAQGLPSPFPPLAYAGLYFYELGNDPAPVRQTVKLTPRSGRPRRDIVLIIDESIAGQYLDVNARSGVHSGLAAVRPGIAVYNYGLAAAVTNCSVGSNLTLRYGGTRTDYRRINKSMPSIWEYAKRARLRTTYIDGQRTGGGLQNLMTTAETKWIDDFVQFGDVAIRDRDMAAADRLIAMLANDTADFVIVNKVGAHFPVHDKYPDAFMRYTPTLPRGQHENISDTGDRSGFGGTAADWVRYRNAYRNVLLWSVGAFFDRLLADGDFSHATLIYTSDHGQDLHETRHPGLDTHCSGDPVPQEGLVPLVAIEGSAAR